MFPSTHPAAIIARIERRERKTGVRGWGVAVTSPLIKVSDASSRVPKSLGV